jgi:hypothetical protein
MSQKKTVNKKAVTALAALCIIALVGLNLAVYSYWQQSTTIRDRDTQILDLQDQLSAPKLVSVGLKYTDDRSGSPMLRITGYVVNVGNTKANNCTLHVNAIQNANATAIDTTATIEPIDAGAYKQIDAEFTYTGQALVAYNTYLKWTT